MIASFATGPGATTLPMRIYSAVRLGVSPEINAISTLLIAGVAALVSRRLAAAETREVDGGVAVRRKLPIPLKAQSMQLFRSALAPTNSTRMG